MSEKLPYYGAGQLPSRIFRAGNEFMFLIFQSQTDVCK
jgi:hypothetical protein